MNLLFCTAGSGMRKKDAKKEATKNILSEMENAGFSVTPVTRALKKVPNNCCSRYVLCCNT